MTDALFDLDQPPHDAPRCAMCARPARVVKGIVAMYCAGKACSNRERLCARCDGPFHLGVNGAGTKYCSDVCRTKLSPPDLFCAWCGTPGQGRPPRGHWPYLCKPCIDPIRHLRDRLTSHRVPHEMAKRLLTDPTCEVCGRDIVAKVRSSNDGKIRSALVVDHDHGCCPGAFSCGQCVRGLLCTQCNSAAGLLGENADVALALARYLGANSPVFAV